MECTGCRAVLEEKYYLNCHACRSHYCFECLKIDRSKVSELDTTKLAKLRCPSCANVTRRRNDDNSPARPQPHTSFLSNSKKTQSGPSPTIELQNLSISDISKLFDEKLSPGSSFMVNLRTALMEDTKALIRSELSSAIGELRTDFTKTTDFIMSDITDVKAELKIKDAVIADLESNQSRLSGDIEQLQKQIATLEKLSRDNNVELQAVPENRTENTVNIFQHLCKTINAPVLEADVRACRRVAKTNPASNRPRNIIVTLSSPRMRDAVLAAASRYNKAHSKDLLSSKHLGIEGESRRIYVSEHLPPHIKQLHAAARAFAKSNNFQFVWVKFGQIYLRKESTCEAIRVKNVEHLNTLPK